MGNITLQNDRSFQTYLSTDTWLTTFPNGTAALEVDSGTWYVIHEGIWYNAEDGSVRT